MPGGTLTIFYSGGGTTEVGSITTINESMQKSCTVVPLVSMHVDDTFAVESRSSKTVNISFKRNNSDWDMNNATWIRRMEAAVDRWQCETDGCTLTYTPDSDNPYIAAFDLNGYIKSFIYRYASGSPEVIEGSIEFHAGTMYSNSQPKHSSIARQQSQFSVMISDVTGAASFPLLGDDLTINCIESYTLCGGPESPFEYLTMTVPRNRLAEVASPLVEENGIVAGRNTVSVRAVGECDMTVTKCKLRNNKYTITAYCNADKLRGVTLDVAMEDTPLQIITSILGNPAYGVNFSVADGNLVLAYDPDSLNVGRVSFARGRNAWYVLQVAAMLIGCRVFFANNKAYVVDFRMPDETGGVETLENGINLYPTNTSITAGTVSLGDEGIDTIINKLQLTALKSTLNEDGTPKYVAQSEADMSNLPDHTVIKDGYVIYNEIANIPVPDDEGSIAMFGERSASVHVEDLTQYEQIIAKVQVENPEDPEGDPIEEDKEIQQKTTQAEIFGQNLISYRNEPQQSIEFTIKEMHKVSNSPTWAPEYLPAARAAFINDRVDDVYISNESDLTHKPKYQKLCLSTYERHFPQGTTTYTWGVMASIDLSSSTSQIMTSLDNS